MSGATTAMWVAGTAAALGTGYSIYAGEQQKDDAKAARRDAQAAQKKTEAQADQAMNAANKKAPDVTGILDAARKKGETSGTMLTGSTGIDPNALTLGKNTLLGS